MYVSGPPVRLACGGVGADGDTAWDVAGSPAAARAAAGAVANLAARIADGRLANG